MANKEKRPAEMETPTGTCTMTFPDYNMFTPEEQEKAVKIMELFWMGLQVNGLNKRDRSENPTNTFPTMFFNFSGHVSLVDFRCFLHGYRDESDTNDHDEYQCQEVWLCEKGRFLDKTERLRMWLHDILEGMKHDA